MTAIALSAFSLKMLVGIVTTGALCFVILCLPDPPDEDI